MTDLESFMCFNSRSSSTLKLDLEKLQMLSVSSKVLKTHELNCQKYDRILLSGGEPLVCLYNKYLYIFLLRLRAVFYIFLKITNQISHNRFMYQIPKIKSFI